MAEQQQECGVDLDHNQFCCSVCLDLLKEPVTIPCGHSYCKSCIEGCWDQEDEKGEYSCPQCREAFNPRPVLRRNNMLAEVVEKLKKTDTQQASPPDAVASAGPAVVACDFCCETRRNKATMSCLTCLASYCPAHLEPHYSVPVLKKHQLVSATMPLEEKMCAKHNKLMEIYCQTDKKCICYLCIIDEHKRHFTVSAAAERAEEQKELIVSQKKVQERFQEREKELTELVQALKDFKSCSETAVKTSNGIFDKLISSILKKRTEAEQLIKAQEKTAVAQAEGLQLQLEEEIANLRRRDTELEKLSQMDDHIHFIQTFQSLSTSCENPDLLPGPAVCSQHSFITVTDCVSELTDDMERLLNDTWPTISATVSAIDVVLPPVPTTREEFLRLSAMDVVLPPVPTTREEFLRLSAMDVVLPPVPKTKEEFLRLSAIDVLPPVPTTREEFLRYCCPLTLDGNSISNHLSISHECQRVTSTVQDKYYYNHYNQKLKRKRIPSISQVLCREALSERSYWEVSKSGGTWSVAVSYMNRSSHGEFGNDNKSWSLNWPPNGYSFRHNNESVTVSGPQTSKIGVFLDYEAGTLSFYSVSDTMTLLHKEQTRFTQPFYPSIGMKDDGSVSCKGCYAELMKLW